MFEPLENVKILGGAPRLNDEISQVDQRMQRMSQATEDVKSILSHYSGQLAGNQFKKAIDNASQFSDILYDCSVKLNRVQHDLVHYIDKVRWLNDQPPCGISPRAHMVERVRIVVNQRDDIIVKDKIRKVIDSLNNYCQGMKREADILVSEKNSIGNIWKDDQYRQYSGFIEEIHHIISIGVRQLQDYSDYLRSKIEHM